MLARLKRASRARRALVWALVALFALAPAIGMASASPAGAFSRVFLHIHEHADNGRLHQGHHHLDLAGHHHDEGAHTHHDDAPALHVHHGGPAGRPGSGTGNGAVPPRRQACHSTRRGDARCAAGASSSTADLPVLALTICMAGRRAVGHLLLADRTSRSPTSARTSGTCSGRRPWRAGSPSPTWSPPGASRRRSPSTP